MTAPSPKVSVLIPTYNYGRYLPEAIESVLRQDYRDFELIISDDCSPDNSAEIIRRYASKDSRIRACIHPKNLGMVANWNWSLQQARGEYIKYLFGDDCLASADALSAFVKMLENDPSAVLAASARFTTNSISEVTGIWDELKREGSHIGKTVISRCLQENANLIGEPSVVIFRRPAGARGYDPALKQVVDLEMWFHLLLQGDIIYTPHPLCCFRQHENQQTMANRISNTGNIEMAALIRRYLPKLAQTGFGFKHRSVIFRALLHLRKKDQENPAIASEITWLESQLTGVWRQLCWLEYRARRPLENFKRSFNKRRHKLSLTKRYAAQLSFLRGLRDTTVS